MSRDVLGSDDNEPVRAHSDHTYFITRGEYNYMVSRVEKLDDKFDVIVGKVDKICTHIESQEKAKKTMYRNIGIITGAINAVVLMILNAWKVVSGQ